ncbi:MAG: S8 family serine peptidase, partial [FCB group bacterium]
MWNFKRNYFLVVFLSIYSLILLIENNDVFSQTKDVLQVVQKNYSYQIVQRGEKLSDGTYKPSKVYKMEKLAPEHYLPNAFYIKTKKSLTIASDKKSVSSFSLQTVLQDINVTSIKAPFADNSKVNKLQATDKIGVDRIYEIYYKSDSDPYEVCKGLMANSEIEYAVPIFIRYPCDVIPNDPRLSNQWAVVRMLMPQAWAISEGDTNVVIAIVDSGTDWTHDDLNANIWTNPGETGKDAKGNDKRTNGIDDDGDGKVDDWHGWDFVGNRDYNQLNSGDYVEDNNPTNLTLIHGTHVSGCASAVTNNGIGIAGIGFKCKLLPVKCASDMYSWAGIYRGFDGIKYAADMGAAIINCSWGGAGSSPAEQDIINYAVSKGSLVVVAAGNNYGQNIDDGGFYPAGYDNVLCVGATNSNDQVADFSNIGSRVTVYSPGQDIDATI